ncbi:MAG: TetR/AcrR family transcriptional regulator [Solirubrobacteraceae bacterium]|nr:TetR/AcrR family transcriptional regulator [Solirubrobacteraceae bacterium]
MTEASSRVDGRKLRYAGRRDELLRAVTAYVLEQGVGQLAIRPMAESVGVSHATLLNHFGTKENLITEVVDLLRQQSMPIDPEAPIPDDVANDAASAIASWWAAWTHPDYLPALRLTFEVYGQALLHPERYERFLEDVVGGWLRFFTRVADAAGCPPDELEATGTTLLATMRGLQLDLVATGDTARANVALELLIAEVARREALWRETAADA